MKQKPYKHDEETVTEAAGVNLKEISLDFIERIVNDKFSTESGVVKATMGAEYLEHKYSRRELAVMASVYFIKYHSQRAQNKENHPANSLRDFLESLNIKKQ